MGWFSQESFAKSKMLRKVLVVFALLFLVSVLSFKVYRVWSKSAQKFSGQCIKDIEYVPGSGNPFQYMDIYIPDKPKSLPMPVIVWIHGGAWVAGDKNHPPAQFILERGYAVASLNYRLSNAALFPAQIHDCKAAIRFLRAHAGEYKIDPERIGVWGHSAGGHLAALLAASGNVNELEGELGNNKFSSRIQAAAEWAGPSDLFSVASQAGPECKIDFKSPTNPVALLLGPQAKEVDYLRASPVHFVTKDDPPVLILHAEDDDVVPVAQAKELCAALKKKQVLHLCHIADSGGHGLFKPEFIEETMDFFDKNLNKN